MIIYKCIVSGDEMISDTYRLEVVDDVFFKVVGTRRPKTGGDIDLALIGGNPSEDPDCRDDDDGATGGSADVEMETNIVGDYRLVETCYTKKAYQAHLKEYMQKIIAHLERTNPDRVPSFKTKCKAAVGKVMPQIKEYQFFTGETMNPDGMVVLSLYEGESPVFYFFKDGLIEEKC